MCSCPCANSSVSREAGELGRASGGTPGRCSGQQPRAGLGAGGTQQPRLDTRSLHRPATESPAASGHLPRWREQRWLADRAQQP